MPPKGHYATGILFLDQDESLRNEIIKEFEVQAAELGLQILVWRKVPTDSSCLGMILWNYGYFFTLCIFKFKKVQTLAEKLLFIFLKEKLDV